LIARKTKRKNTIVLVRKIRKRRDNTIEMVVHEIIIRKIKRRSIIKIEVEVRSTSREDKKIDRNRLRKIF
jgi:hypothetical protein